MGLGGCVEGDFGGGGDDWDDIGGDSKRERRGLMRFPGNGASEYRLCGKS